MKLLPAIILSCGLAIAVYASSSIFVNSRIFKGTQILDDSLPPNPLARYIGEWKARGDSFVTNFSGKYDRGINPNRIFIAKSTSLNRSVVWDLDFDGFKVDIFWTYDFKTKKLYHLSNTIEDGLANGVGDLKENGDLDIKLIDAAGCKTCYRLYSYRWKSDDEIYFKCTFHKDGKPTGDYYGMTFIRQK